MNLYRVNRNTFYLLLAFMIALSTLAFGFPGLSGKALGAGTFSVSGTKIVDRNGAEFVVKGVNVNGEYWPWTRNTANDAGLIVDNWKFNTIRVNMYPRLAYNGVAKTQDISAIVNAYTAKGAIVIIENHDVTGRYPEASPVTEGSDRYPSLSEMVTWWKDMAVRFKDNDRVWFNPMNEPGIGTYSLADSVNKWYSTNDTLIGAIRSVAPSNIIVVDDHDYGQGNGFVNGASSNDSAIVSKGTQLKSKYTNLVFSVHMYEKWTSGETRFNNYVNTIRTKGLPIIVGEYGVGNNADVSVVDSMFAVAVPNNVGRIAWAWTGDDIFDLTTGTTQGGGYEINSTTSPTNLSWFGDKTWKDNRGTLSVPLYTWVAPLDNGDFEGGLRNWNNWSGSSDDTSLKYAGYHSLKIASGSAGGAGQFAVLKKNKTYKLTARGKHSATASTATALGIKWTVGGVETNYPLNFTSSSWDYKEVTFTTPNSEMGDMILYIWKADSGVQFNADNITLTEQ
ncbi:cellulase family glycosylhydrolase [Paenibacillus roseipurpureus]|uniref:Cellulase family glycosylhydrolase n=1 Tax=Paenibacillus roseopurpureus TaxID=2918901 RepID=A0AA96LRZ4_9BACL|nr:cellulase family glycosylhydrolase [Paenibacillus sp. MBLB1832]WNR46137.1 cellulase family glycosylhydrolase [Paenibacillus sp. MBLB1832]